LPYKEESVLVLVKATPNWSREYKKYLNCTAGINEGGEWRRLYPMPQEAIYREKIRVWDKIKLELTEPDKDPRPESRKVKVESIKNLGCALKTREERRKFIEEHEDSSLDIPNKEKRTMALIKPLIVDFEIEKRKEEVNQATLYGGIFKQRPYGDVGLYYRFKCWPPCKVCSKRPHKMECFDWGANVLYRRYDDERVAREKVRDMCYVKMKSVYDTWFALGTHSNYPFSKWLLVGLLWMTRKED